MKVSSVIPVFILTIAAVVAASSCASKPLEAAAASPRRHQLLDADWLFHRGDISTNENVIAPDYDDKNWQPIHLPHDYVLDGAYDSHLDRSHGYLPVTVGWYRKHFVIPESDKGKVLQLEFGGIFRDSQIWLNGHFLGRHLSGYTSFYYDISQAANYGGDNILVVRVDPRKFEGWWYEGGGIYRHVYLNTLSPLHVAHWGTYITSEVTNDNREARLTLQTTIENAAASATKFEVVSEIIGPDGRVIKNVKTDETVSANSKKQIVQQTTIFNPQLWSLDSPQLYKLRTTVKQNGRAVDFTTTTFGVRTIYFDANKGFFLNGKHVKINGVANHQDFPAVGIAVPDSLEAWRVKQVKLSGANAWRTAHNPPNEEVLDECDRQGLLVMDENRHFGDTYRHHSPSGTTSTNLSDLADMIQRDRNHPSIIMWSLCNEETLQGKPEGAKIFSAMMRVVHQYDRTRPITCAMSGGWLQHGIADVEDIIGVNYGYNSYDAIRKKHPDKPLFGSELANNKTARGEYAYNRANGWMSSYNLTEPGWKPSASRSYFAGSFVWTGFDYRGEPNPDGWPDVSNNTGIMDNCGFPKDKYYYLKSWWTDKPLVHLLPQNWNWPGKEGQKIRVIVFSNARKVEVFLNGKSFGVQIMPRFGHLEWQIPYAPGKLLAKGYNADGQVAATDLVETVGAPARIQLSSDRQTLRADGEDTIVVPVSILDAQGRFVSYANNRIHFTLTGGGKILGVANGNPADHDPDRASERNAFNGHCLAVIQADSHPETLSLTAASPGLAPAHLAFNVR